jgi:pimeloyl-ACP methyl ester carboxylesterase
VFEAAARRVANALSDAELRPVPGSGHAIQIDAQSSVAAAVRGLSRAGECSQAGDERAPARNAAR